MKTRAVCPACHTKVMLPSSATPTCPACGAGLKRKGNRGQYEVNEDAPRPARTIKKKRKKRSGPNYPLIAGIGGSVVVLGAVVWIAIVAVQGFRRPITESNRPEVQVGAPGLYRTCFSVYPCKTPYATARRKIPGSPGPLRGTS